MKINTSEDEDSDHVEPFEIPVISKKAREQTNINSKIFSDDVNNMCLIKCNICQMTFSSHKKRIHFRTYHTDFKHSYTYARKTYYRCPDCAAEFLFCFTYLSNHATVKHKITWEEFKAKYLRNIKEEYFSDNVSELCQYRCLSCEEENIKDKEAHTRKVHKNDKNTNYEVMEKVLHRCKICNATVIFNQRAIMVHLSKYHSSLKIRFKEYSKKYLSLESQIKIDTSEDEESDHAEAFEIPVIYKKARIAKNKLEEVFKTSEPIKKHNVEKKTDTNSKIFSDDVNNMCLIKCNICDMTMSFCKKDTHFRTYHKDSRPSYSYVRKTYYRCPECAGEFLFCFTSISGHATTKHNISLAEFKAKYLNMKIDKSNFAKINYREQRNEEKRYSNNMSELCKYKCLSCGEENIKDKNIHTKNVHPEMSKKYEVMNKVFHRCKICKRTVIFNPIGINAHLHKYHSSLKISFLKYSKIYLNLEPQDDEMPTNLQQHKETIEKSNFFEIKDKLPTKINNKEKYYSDDMSDLCQYKCLTCGEENIKVKSIHTNNVHPEIKKKYKVMEKVLHRCKICSKPVIFNPVGINGHLKKCHPSLKITFKKYSKTYLNQVSKTYIPYHADFKAKNLQIEPEKPNLSMTNDKMATSLKHEEKYYSNNMSELCKYKCLTCGEENIEVKSTHTNNVHPEIKRKYKMMEIVLHRCKICSKPVIFNPQSISAHLKKCHPLLKITFKKYSKTYLNQVSKAKVTKKYPPGPVRCTYCPILGTKEQIVSHTKLQHKAVSSQVNGDEDEHKAIKVDDTDAPEEVSDMITEEDENYVDEDESENPAKEGKGMKIFTDNVNLLCTSKCMRCKNIVLSSKRKCHIKYHHKGLKFSKKLFRFVRKTYHRCKLCNQELLFSMCSIGEHLRIKHNISTVTQYRWEHCVQQKLVQQGERIVTMTNERTKTKTSVDKSEAPYNEKKRKHEEEDSGQSYKYQRNQDNTLRELAGNTDFLPDFPSDESDEEEEPVDDCYSTDVHKMCLSRCLYCLKIFSLNNIRPHIYKNHSKSTSNNDEQKFVFVRKTYYRCRICGKSLLFSFDSIFLHVKNNHYMNLAEYKDKYMGYNKDKYVYRQRSVYQSSSITSEIKLESSSPSIKSEPGLVPKSEPGLVPKSEPGLVPKSEEQKSLYFFKQSVIENSAVKPKAEAESEQTSTVHNKQASTETTSALSENNSYLDIETIKTELEESDSRLEYQDLKNSEDPVDSPEAHIPEDLENVVKEEEVCKPEFVFKCPFKPCPAFTIEEGLKDGRAANHCIKVHKTRPRQLHKLKLNWVRVPAGHTAWKDSVSNF